MKLICLQKELTLNQLLEKAQKREDAMALNEVMHKKSGEEDKLNKVEQQQSFRDTQTKARGAAKRQRQR